MFTKLIPLLGPLVGRCRCNGRTPNRNTPTFHRPRRSVPRNERMINVAYRRHSACHCLENQKQERSQRRNDQMKQMCAPLPVQMSAYILSCYFVIGRFNASVTACYVPTPNDATIPSTVYSCNFVRGKSIFLMFVVFFLRS